MQRLWPVFSCQLSECAFCRDPRPTFHLPLGRLLISSHYLLADKNDQPLKDCYEAIEIHNYRIEGLFITVRELHSNVRLKRVQAYLCALVYLLVSLYIYFILMLLTKSPDKDL